MHKFRCSLHHAGSWKIYYNAVTLITSMGEKHSNLNPSRPNSGTYTGIIQPSLPKITWATPVMPHCTGAREGSCPTFFLNQRMFISRAKFFPCQNLQNDHWWGCLLLAHAKCAAVPPVHTQCSPLCWCPTPRQILQYSTQWLYIITFKVHFVYSVYVLCQAKFSPFFLPACSVRFVFPSLNQ